MSEVQIRARWLHREEPSFPNATAAAQSSEQGEALPSPPAPGPRSVVVQHGLEILRQGPDDGLDVQTHPLQRLLLHGQVLAPGSDLQGDRGGSYRFQVLFAFDGTNFTLSLYFRVQDNREEPVT